MSTEAHDTHAAPLSVWWLEAPPPSYAAALRLLSEDASCCWFADPTAGEKMLGIGVARDLSDAAAQGPACLARRLRTLRVCAQGAVRHGGALLLGIAPFDPERPAGGAFGAHAAARWVIPRVTFVLREGVSFCAVAGAQSRGEAEALRDAQLARLARLDRAAQDAAAPASHPAHTPAHTQPHAVIEETPEAFRARVAAALEAVASGALNKVVPARAHCIHAEAPWRPARVAGRLFAAEPHALHYAMPLPTGLLLGATPERLLRVDGDRVLVDALAGTAKRGHTPQADAAAKKGLRESKKDQEEHAWTRAAIQGALAAHLAALEYPEAPRVLSTSGLHHLHTPFVGRRGGPSPGALELAALLHPTPAVAGTPRAAALAWLRAHEPLARGAYAGPVGWVDLAGAGALGVALRCALLQGKHAVLFAGAGVVADSRPAAEFEETKLKLRTVEAALQGGVSG